MPPVIEWPHQGPHSRTETHAYEWDDNGFNRRGWFIQSVFENDSVILWDEQLTEYRMSRLAFDRNARRYQPDADRAFSDAIRRTFTNSMNRMSFGTTFMDGFLWEHSASNTLPRNRWR